MTASIANAVGDSFLSSHADASAAYGWDTAPLEEIRTTPQELQVHLEELVS